MRVNLGKYLNRYWLCQLIGWLCMVLIEMVNYTFFIVRKYNSGILYIFLACALIGILLTHGFRRFIRDKNIFQASLSYIWTYAFVSTFIISLLMTVITEIPVILLGKEGWKGLSFIGIAGSTVNWMRYVGVWIIIYFMYKILAQNSAIQKEKLVIENLAKTTELELLKAQLNPHFLFNALNSIKALVVINPEESRTAIVKLSELLRFTLQYGKERYITLQDEMQEVAKYLELEALRFGDRLQVQYQLAVQSMNLTIPPAMVLTLAENAIKHGVARHMGIGTVAVITTLEKTDFLTVRVINSGTYQPGTQTGIGLQHIHKRLDEIYNGRAIFTIDAQDNNVIATLQIPILWQ